MHYKNGRVAKNGDKVILVDCSGHVTVGILYDAQPGNDYCNGKLAPINIGGAYAPNLKECLRMDDAVAAMGAGTAAITSVDKAGG